MNRETRLKRLHYRSHHRGTKEADLMIGGFFDAHAATWTDDAIAWFETLCEEQDVDIMGWAMGTIATPAAFDGPMMRAMAVLDYVPIAR